MDSPASWDRRHPKEKHTHTKAWRKFVRPETAAWFTSLHGSAPLFFAWKTTSKRGKGWTLPCDQHGQKANVTHCLTEMMNQNGGALLADCKAVKKWSVEKWNLCLSVKTSRGPSNWLYVAGPPRIGFQPKILRSWLRSSKAGSFGP